MASYHFSAQIIGRSDGRSAIAAAAYRAGERIKDQKNNVIHDYTRRKGVVYAAILAPSGSAAFLQRRCDLWNAVERMENRKDAQLAREIVLALPHELSAGQRREMLLRFVRAAFVSRGMIADVAIHAPVLEKGDHPHNHHAHVLLPLRQATANGLRKVKTREWNSDNLLREWRALWARYQNEALERANIRERVDHRSLAVQRAEAVRCGDARKAALLDREPEIHLGKRARPRTIEREGAKVAKPPHPRITHNAAILRQNARRAQAQLDMWRRAMLAQANKPKPLSARPPVRRVKQDQPTRQAVLVPNLAPDIAYLFRRMAYGMSLPELVLRARSARLVDFELRYFRSAARAFAIDGRHRLRNLRPPSVPQTLPSPFTPVHDLPG